MPSKWRTVTINLTEEQSRQLKALAGLKGLSQSAYFKHLLKLQVMITSGLDNLINNIENKEIKKD